MRLTPNPEHITETLLPTDKNKRLIRLTTTETLLSAGGGATT